MTVESPVRYQAVWKAYSFIVVGLTAASVVLGGFSLLNLVSGLVSLALVLPLIGYAWQRAIVPRWVGKLAFWFGILAAIGSLFVGMNDLGGLGVLAVLIVACLFLPYLYAVYTFSYRSPHLWAGS